MLPPRKYSKVATTRASTDSTASAVQLERAGVVCHVQNVAKAARDAVRQRDCHFTAVVQHQGHFHGIAVT